MITFYSSEGILVFSCQDILDEVFVPYEVSVEINEPVEGCNPDIDSITLHECCHADRLGHSFHSLDEFFRTGFSILRDERSQSFVWAATGVDPTQGN